MMNNIRQLKESQREAHPGFSSYLECMTRSLFTGLSAFVLAFSGTYFGQKLVAQRLPYTQKHIFLYRLRLRLLHHIKLRVIERTLARRLGWQQRINIQH